MGPFKGWMFAHAPVLCKGAVRALPHVGAGALSVLSWASATGSAANRHVTMHTELMLHRESLRNPTPPSVERRCAGRAYASCHRAIQRVAPRARRPLQAARMRKPFRCRARCNQSQPTVTRSNYNMPFRKCQRRLVAPARTRMDRSIHAANRTIHYV